MQSHFNSHSLAEIFRDLYISERTGELHLSDEDREARVFFNRGLIDYVDSNEPPHDLGQALVDSGRISAGALLEAQRVVKDPVELPQALLNRGLVAKSSLVTVARELAEKIIAATFNWDGGVAAFQERDWGVDLLESDVLSTLRLILHGVASIADFDGVIEAMRGLDHELTLRKPVPIPLEKLTLSRTQGFVLSRIDGRTDFRAMISTLPPEEEGAASRFVFGLLILGVAEFRPTLADGPFRVANILRDHADRCALERMQEKTISEAYSRMRKQNPHEILGVTTTASRTAIDRAYAEAKSLFARDRLLPSVRDRFRSELGVIESRLVEAYLNLTQPARSEKRSEREVDRTPTQNISAEDLLMRPELDKTKRRTEADEAARVGELYYNKARQAMLAGDFHNAIQYGKLAISYSAEDARFYSLVADCQVRNPEARWQRMAEQNYTKATELDPWNAQYWISLGRFYKRRGLHLRARRQFEEALRLVPEHEEATKELAALR
ncbi:MAG TPA: DUF4388 domain-containing protein [Candidatus Polarisedimenticolaceae bacterium]|nr:DUF4388 domain-containing protein [Candidatus Polarisedimenticolaceae bacterium]